MRAIKRRTKSFLKKVQKEQDKKCFLCNISSAEAVFENKKFIVVLDAYPAVKGHILIALKKHYFGLSEVPEQEVKELIILTRRIDKALRKLFKPFRIAIVSTGVAVPHFHFHVIPIPNEEMAWDFKFLKKAKIFKYSKTEQALLKKKIRKAIKES